MKSVISQIQSACANGNRRWALVGFIIGGIIPALTFCIDRYEVKSTSPLYAQVAVYLVLGGMAFSAKTVYQWTKAAYHDMIKAIGTVVIIEGVMIFSENLTFAVVSLIFLVAINGTATACNLVSDWRSEQDEVKQAQRVARKNVTQIKKVA